MRSESEDQQSKSDDETPKFHKKPKISYTRDLLLYLSELDTCKGLPSGLDKSILAGLGTCSTGLSLSCHYSDSGISHGYLSRHSQPICERRLLGSDASPQASSCVSGASDPVIQRNVLHLHKKSNAVYRPPHLSKAKVPSRVESEDFCNDETFGSSEHLSHERAEEERRRRDSFELMRKEQHKAFQGKQNKICDKHKENLDPETILHPEAPGNCKRLINKYNESEKCATSQSEASDPAEHDFTAQTFVSTFLLSFVSENRSLEMNVGKALTGTFMSEPCDTKGDDSRGCGLHSSGLAHQFLGEKTPASGISSGCMEDVFEVYTARNEGVTWQKSTNLSSGRNELAQNLMASTTSSAADESSEQLDNCNKLDVTPGVLSCDDFKPSMLPDLDEFYWHPNSAVQNLSLEKYGLDQTNVETSSKLNRGFLDKLCTSEIEVNGSAKDLQTTEFLGTQRQSIGMITRNDLLKTNGFPFLDGDNSYIIPSTVNESGSIKMNCEGIMSPSCTKQTVVSKTESLPISIDTQTKNRFNLRSEPECKLSPLSCFYEDVNPVGEICLPDEDSLITVEDCILPHDSSSIAAGCSFRTNLFASGSQVDIADKLAAVHPFLIDERSTQLGLEGPIFDSYDIMGLKTSYANLHTQQYLPQFGHYQMNPGRAFFKSSNAQQVQMSSKAKPLGSKNHLYNPHTFHHFPANVRADHFQHPQADPRFGQPINSQLQQQMPVPNQFSSPHQVLGLSRDSFSSHPIHEMAYYPQELHPTQYFPFRYQQQKYRGLGMQIPGPPASGIVNQADAYRHFEMDKIKADASFSHGWPWFKNL